MLGREKEKKDYEDAVLFSVGGGGLLGMMFGYYFSTDSICVRILSNTSSVANYLPKPVYVIREFTTIATCEGFKAAALQVHIANLNATIKLLTDVCPNYIAVGYGVGAMVGVGIAATYVYCDQKYERLKNASISFHKEIEHTVVTIEPPAPPPPALLPLPVTLTPEEEHINKLIAGLNAYRTRIASHCIDHGFSYFAVVQVRNRQANYALAGELIAELKRYRCDGNSEQFQELFSASSLKNLRKFSPWYSLGINSVELNGIIKQALDFSKPLSAPSKPSL